MSVTKGRKKCRADLKPPQPIWQHTCVWKHVARWICCLFSPPAFLFLFRFPLCSQPLSTLLSQSAPPPHLLPSSSLLQASWVPVSRLLAFYPHSLHTPHLPSLSTNAGCPFFTPTTSSTLYPASALFSQANHAEMQCNCANVSYPSFSSLHPSAGLFECKQWKTTPLWKT